MSPFMKTGRHLIGGLVALLPCACGPLVETPYAPPEIAVPAQWSESNAGPRNPLSPWWRRFDDSDLDRLVEEALACNNDLAAATIKVRKAQLQAGLAADKFVPALGAETSIEGSKDWSDRSFQTLASTTSTGSITGTLSYEADLWGRLARSLDAARWEAAATREDRDNTALALAGTTATLYWKALYLKQRVEMSRQDIAYAEQTLDLVRVQKKSGAVSALEVLEAEENLRSQEADHNDYLRQQSENNNALAILFDGPPRSIKIPRPGLPTGELPSVDAGLPLQLLGRRPDLRAAELRLRESLATVDATRASYLPTLTLTGSMGSSSTALTQILQNPVGTLGAGLTLPFLQWNEMQLTVKGSEADYEKAVVTFRQTLYSALSDVENALQARRRYTDQGVKLDEAVAAARRAEQLYALRFKAGGSTLQVWLDAQSKRRALEETLLENHLNRLVSQVTLYQALGGDTPATP